jgi:putative nucleotidyltransferase with HDIG domain
MGLLKLGRRLMNLDESKPRKRIPLSALKPGMHIVELDRSWLSTPFMSHRMQIHDMADVALLEKHGVREVIIEVEEMQAGEEHGEARTELSQDAAEVRHSPAKSLSDNGAAPFVDKARQPAVDMHKASGSMAEQECIKKASAIHEQVLQPLIQELPVAQNIHQQALAAAQIIFDGVGRGSALNSPQAKQTVKDLLSSVTRSPEASLLLTQMRRFQSDLFTHAVNVCVLSLVVATLEGVTREVSELGLGALLHDIGQMRLPRNLIRKTEGYTDQERRLLEQHPALGAAILDRSKDFPESVRFIVMEHHERLNGTGYPLQKRGSSLSFLSQIVAITDVYDSMITGRCGVIQRPIDVLRQLYLDANAGAFDRDLVEKVIRSLGVYPVGSLVELTTGERGIVLAANRSDTLRPTIRLVLSRDGLPLSRGPIVSLAEDESVSIGRQIRRTLDPGRERVDVMSHLRLATGLAG